jgi:hypothetical protein
MCTLHCSDYVAGLFLAVWTVVETFLNMMMILLLFLQKQNLASVCTCLGSVLASPDQG